MTAKSESRLCMFEFGSRQVEWRAREGEKRERLKKRKRKRNDEATHGKDKVSQSSQIWVTVVCLCAFLYFSQSHFVSLCVCSKGGNYENVGFTVEWETSPRRDCLLQRKQVFGTRTVLRLERVTLVSFLSFSLPFVRTTVYSAPHRPLSTVSSNTIEAAIADQQTALSLFLSAFSYSVKGDDCVQPSRTAKESIRRVDRWISCINLTWFKFWADWTVSSRSR